MDVWWFCCKAGNFLCILWRILNFKIFVFILKFKKYGVRPDIHNLVHCHWHVLVQWKPGCQPKPKKCHIFVIFHRKCSILTTFYNSQRNRKFAFLGGKSLKFGNPFIGLAPRNLTVRVLVFDKLFIPVLCQRIYRVVRDYNFTVRKSLTVLVLVNDKYRAMNDTENYLFNKIENWNKKF
jgi:hypothetical protein